MCRSAGKKFLTNPKSEEPNEEGTTPVIALVPKVPFARDCRGNSSQAELGDSAFPSPAWERAGTKRNAGCEPPRQDIATNSQPAFWPESSATCRDKQGALLLVELTGRQCFYRPGKDRRGGSDERSARISAYGPTVARFARIATVPPRRARAATASRSQQRQHAQNQELLHN